MSWEITERVRKNSAHRRAAKMVLQEIAQHANQRGLAWPSITRIAEITGISVRSVINHIKRLEESGELTVYRWRGRHNFYVIRLGASDEDLETCAKDIALRTGKKEEEVWHELTASCDTGEDSAQGAGVIGPVQNLHQCKTCMGPVQNLHGTRAEFAHESIIESVMNKSNGGTTLASARSGRHRANPPPTGSNGSRNSHRREKAGRSAAEGASGDRVAIRDEVIEACKFSETARSDRESYGRAGRITRYLLGQPTKEHGVTYTIPHEHWRARPGDFLAFAQYWRNKYNNADVPRSLEKLHERWCEWREHQDQQRTRLQEQLSVGSPTLLAETLLYRREVTA